ncbi:hypothetical protein GCM10022267_75370 [Lentzea roselyniae]|uniref:Immunity protein 35 n=1 Tax=Lentzea roselyniae TaxID=531940 RepID=A0ABP7C5V3_9PSEU
MVTGARNEDGGLAEETRAYVEPALRLLVRADAEALLRSTPMRETSRAGGWLLWYGANGTLVLIDGANVLFAPFKRGAARVPLASPVAATRRRVGWSRVLPGRRGTKALRADDGQIR